MKKVFAFLFIAIITQSVFADFTCDTDITDYYAVYEKNTYTCQSGQYLPANADNCVSCAHGYSCPGGTYEFNPLEEQGIFEASFTCSSGYFLPADADVCEICPSGYTCSGGTFDFNPNEFQGIDIVSVTENTINNICAVNFPSDFYVAYEPNTHECSPGYYLPANVDACTECLNDSWCPGGTYTFDETTNQGINSCPSEHPFAPKGMWLSTQCGRKLHFANNNHHDVLYLHQQPANPTQHKLKILYAGNNTLYYANTVLKDTTPGAVLPKLSNGAQKELHVTMSDIIDGIKVNREYLVCDDSVLECRNNQ